ncbi:MAG: TatD family hydrolase [Muribaculaceae bacterium]|nr:TatD family hydrolase [Muribaculaceae bacterium]MDE6753413.1 TatD family hydrolase [Muribaculaceae bacterium]
MIDTHSHPYLPEFDDGGKGAVDRALSAGVSHIILPNVDITSLEPMIALHESRPDATSIAIGLHPTEVREDWEKVVEGMKEILQDKKCVAVGEVGMDLYWDKSHEEAQKKAFALQLKIAEEMRLPVIIHCREALDETLEVIEEVKPTVPLIFHSFTGSPDDVRKIRKVCNPMFGINGVVTFKNAKSLRESIPEIGIDYLLLETDAPYLAPVPHRGKRNESAYLVHTLNAVANALGMEPGEAEEATDRNARKTFSL